MVTIISVFPKSLSLELPWSPNKGAGLHRYELPAAPKDGYASLVVERAYQKTYFGENVGSRFDSIEAISIAENLLHVWAENIVGTNSGTGPGIFLILDRDKPTKEELEAAVERQTQFFHYLFEQAEALFRTGKPEQITQEMRDAAKWLGRNSADWLKPVEKIDLKKCPFCISDIPSEATVCRVCQKDVDGVTYPSAKKRG